MSKLFNKYKRKKGNIYHPGCTLLLHSTEFFSILECKQFQSVYLKIITEKLKINIRTKPRIERRISNKSMEHNNTNWKGSRNRGNVTVEMNRNSMKIFGSRKIKIVAKVTIK